jgi:hypothetical protein
MPSSPLARSKLLLAVAFLAIAVLSILLRALVHPYAMYELIHDDALYVHLARQILDSGWISDWSDVTTRTLGKGPGFPVYLAINHSLFPWTFLVTNQCLILLATFALIREFNRFGLGPIAGLIIFTGVAFFPVWYSEPASRVNRDAFLAVLVMLILALSLVARRHLISLAAEKVKATRILRYTWSVGLLGVVLGYYYVTKVNWQPFLVVSVLMLATAFLQARRETWKRLGLVTTAGLVVSVTVAGIVVAAVVVKNESSLGVAAVEDFGSGPFADSVNQLMRIDDSNRPDYVDVSLAMMSKAAEVSPSFAKAWPYLQDTFWDDFECQNLGLCTGDFGLWFPWALRDAAESAGYGVSASSFENYFRLLAVEIQQACAEGRLACSDPGLAPQVSPLSRQSPRLVLDAMGHGLNHIFTLSSAHVTVEEDTNIVSPELWQSTVRGLLTEQQREKAYNPGSWFMAGITTLLSNAYRSLWPFLLLVGSVSLFIVPRKKETSRKQTMRIPVLLTTLGVCALFAMALYIGQLALLEAAGGVFMLSAGSLYLIPIYPLILFSLMAAWTRLQVLFGPADHSRPTR